MSETFVRAKVSDTSKALVDNLTVFYVFSLGLPKLRPAGSTNAGRSLFSWRTDGKADYLNRLQRCQSENCSVPVSKSQPSVKMIVRRMSRTPRRTIRQSQGGFQEPGFLNRFLSKFLCRHKEILCIQLACGKLTRIFKKRKNYELF